MYRIGDFVKWVAFVRGKTYPRAGEVIVIVPPNSDPATHVPPRYDLHIRGKARSTLSFLVRIPGCRNLYWPNVESLSPLPVAEYSLLYSQSIYAKARNIPGLDRSDRVKVRALCKMMSELFGDAYFENAHSITVPAWGRRFYFKVLKGVEYVNEVETFVPVWIGKSSS